MMCRLGLQFLTAAFERLIVYNITAREGRKRDSRLKASRSELKGRLAMAWVRHVEGRSRAIQTSKTLLVPCSTGEHSGERTQERGRRT
mgnify:FL=1